MAKDTKGSYDIQSILTEMREEYWQGLAETEDVQEERLECITFSLGGEIYAFESVYAAEVIRIPKLVRLPKVQDIIVGVFNLRGGIMAAIDIRLLLGVPQTPITACGKDHSPQVGKVFHRTCRRRGKGGRVPLRG